MPKYYRGILVLFFYLQPFVNSHTEGEIWGLSTHPEKEVFVTGSDDKTVRLWDLVTRVGFTLILISIALDSG